MEWNWWTVNTLFFPQPISESDTVRHKRIKHMEHTTCWVNGPESNMQRATRTVCFLGVFCLSGHSSPRLGVHELQDNKLSGPKGKKNACFSSPMHAAVGANPPVYPTRCCPCHLYFGTVNCRNPNLWRSFAQYCLSALQRCAKENVTKTTCWS